MRQKSPGTAQTLKVNVARRSKKPPAGEGKTPPQRSGADESELRIIGGEFRARKLAYHGGAGTRPMKHRVREAIFNLLGPSAKGKHAIDLFAGTGALGLEALSRGSLSATFIERHIPTARTVRENVQSLQVEHRCEIATANAFIWARREPKLPDVPWLVFCSPPYDYYLEKTDEVLAMLEGLAARAPQESIFVVEADMRFEVEKLPQPEQWDVRRYPPAVVAIRGERG
ncbi:MAG: RsmD family RNA methyltransferase [Pirellulales bacterium]